MSAPDHHMSMLLRKLESIFELSSAEKAAILALPRSVVDLRSRQDIVRDGDRPSRSCVVLEGLACRYKLTFEGKRQIFSFHIPGEIPDVQSLHLRTMDHSFGTLTSCKVAFLDYEHVNDLIERFPRIGAAMWRETLIDAAIFRQWMLGLGRKEASSRLAHLFCEMFARLKAVGLADGDTCPFPISQTELGDALGLSTVHVNRTLQELRTQGLVVLTRSSLTIKDPARLKELADFDPTYLHQRWREAA